MDWKECKDKRLVKEISSDKNLIKSLITSSKKKYETNKRIEIDNITSSTKISIIYESLREILEAIAIKKGFKIYNYECFCAFLNEICKDLRLGNDFNEFRIIRNRVNYYGKEIEIKEARDLIKNMISLRNKLIEKYIR